MTPTAYRAALERAGLTQMQAARELGINERTSRRYAKKGVSPRMSRIIEAALTRIEEARAK